MKRLAHYSQYFLRNPQFIGQLIGRTSIGPRDMVYDIGAGSGAITAELAKVAHRVVAVEYESRMAGKLRENMQGIDNVEVQEADFLTMTLPVTPYKIFANIPFHLSSPIVRRLVEVPHPPVTAYLIVQKQFGNKLLQEHEGFTGQLGMQIGPLVAVSVVKRLRRTDYWPHPNVDTMLIELRRRKQPLIADHDMANYRSFVEQSFSTPAFFAKTAREKIDLPAGIKPSEMQLADWIRLFEASKNLYKTSK
jgi:16S rRNA A1518/A1519 N6-dimethyltransferase RsmA/KsgA/DIM1 with predicted DNA glycosylase/AP lyase activity